MQALPIVLAFVGGGLAEAIVAFAAHHLHKPHDAGPPAWLHDLVEDAVTERVQQRLLELDQARTDVPMDVGWGNTHRAGHWSRGEIKMMESIAHLAERHQPLWRAIVNTPQLDMSGGSGAGPSVDDAAAQKQPVQAPLNEAGPAEA
jgi:hypothetical protein